MGDFNANIKVFLNTNQLQSNPQPPISNVIPYDKDMKLTLSYNA